MAQAILDAYGTNSPSAIINNEGDNIYHLITKRNDNKSLALLNSLGLVKKEDLNKQRSLDLNTPLHLAVINDNRETIETLLKLGANPRIKNRDKLIVKIINCSSKSGNVSKSESESDLIGKIDIAFSEVSERQPKSSPSREGDLEVLEILQRKQGGKYKSKSKKEN